MSDTEPVQPVLNIIPQKPPPPPRREAGEPIHPSDPVETPVPKTDPAAPVEVPQKPIAPRQASPSRPPASRRLPERVVIPPRDGGPEIISKRDMRPMGRAANITTAALPLAVGDFEPAPLSLLGFPGLQPAARRR